jgi:UDP-N-acetylglucosamine--N-acetylmuramyl-(pentapeptide) pyrophosphoryl-undecaprenol N-acetylglucosamine transferase
MSASSSGTSPLKVMIAAGGTGGHLFPAESLARELKNRGCAVELVSDDRVKDFADRFPADAIHEVTSGTVTGGGVASKLRGVFALGLGVWQCRGLVKRIQPAVAIGFGGYPTVPPILAASLLGVPTVLHEQNAVMGRANRFLSGRVSRIATGFAIAKGDPKFVHVGNPVRAAVIDAARTPMLPPIAGGPLRLLVFGGSQGARIMGEIVPPAVALLPEAQRRRLMITQQVRAEDMDRVTAEYARLGVQADCAPFFKDLPVKMAASQLVIARSGASTIAELSVMGRPALLVPLPGALDQDQAANARVLAEAGGAEIMLQPAFTPQALAARLGAILDAPGALFDMGAKARSIGIADAASRTADVVLQVAGSRNIAKATG